MRANSVNKAREARDRNIGIGGNDEKTRSEERMNSVISKFKNRSCVRSIINEHGIDDDSMGGLGEREEIAGERETDFMARGVRSKGLRDGRIDFTRKDVKPRKKSGDGQTANASSGINYGRGTKRSDEGRHGGKGNSLRARGGLGVTELLKRRGKMRITSRHGPTKLIETGL
jgi:hypothetical protein